MSLSLYKLTHTHTRTHTHTHTQALVLIFANTLINTNSSTILIWLITKAAISPLIIELDARQEFPMEKKTPKSLPNVPKPARAACLNAM